MRELLELLKFLGPYLIPFFTVVGFLATIVLWPRIRAWFTGSSNGSGRRRDDDLIEKLMTQNAEMMNAMIKVVGDNTAALQKVAGTLEENGKKLDRHNESIEHGFTRIHERLDDVILRRAS